MKHFSGMFKRIMAMLLAAIMLISSSNIGLVAHVFAQETDSEQEKVTLGQLIVSNYDQLNEKEETIIRSGYLAADKDIPYGKPTKDDDLVSVNKDTKIVTAEPFEDAAGNLWIPATFDLVDGDGVALENHDNLPLNESGNVYSGTYTTDAYTFVVNVTYQLHVDVDVAEQEAMLQAAQKLADDIAILQHLDKVVVYDEYSAKTVLQSLTMEQDGQTVIDMLESLTDEKYVDLPLPDGTFEADAEMFISNRKAKTAINALVKEQDNGGLALYVFMDNSANGNSYLEWLVEHGDELEAALSSNYDDLVTVYGDSALGNVSYEMDYFLNTDIPAYKAELLSQIQDMVEPYEAEYGISVKTLEDLPTALATVEDKYAKTLADLNDLLVTVGYLTSVDDPKAVKSSADMTDDVFEALRGWKGGQFDDLNKVLTETGYDKTVTDASGLTEAFAHLEKWEKDVYSALNTALDIAGWEKADVATPTDITDEVFDTLASWQDGIYEDLENALAAIGRTDIVVVDADDIDPALAALNSWKSDLYSKLNTLLATAGSSLRVNQASDMNDGVKAALENWKADIYAKLSDVMAEAGYTGGADLSPEMFAALEAYMNDQLKDLNVTLEMIGYEGKVTKAADIDDVITYINETNETEKGKLEANVIESLKAKMVEEDPSLEQYANMLTSANEVETVIGKVEQVNNMLDGKYDGLLETLNAANTLLDQISNNELVSTLTDAKSDLQKAEELLAKRSTLKSDMDDMDKMLADWESNKADLDQLEKVLSQSDLTSNMKKLDDVLEQRGTLASDLAELDELQAQQDDLASNMGELDDMLSDPDKTVQSMVDAEKAIQDLKDAIDGLGELEKQIKDAQDQKKNLDDLIELLTRTTNTLKPVVDAFDNNTFTAETVLKDGLTSAQYKELTETATGCNETPESAKNPLFVTEAVVEYQMSMSDVNIEVIANVIPKDSVDSDVTVALEIYKDKVTLEDGATKEQILEAVEKSEAVKEALAQEAWVDVNVSEDNYDITYSKLPETLPGAITYTITFNPRTLEVDLVGEKKSVPFGYNLTLPEHEDDKKEYVYTVTGEEETPNVDQGTVVRVTEDLVITRVEGAASAKQSINSLLVNTNTVTNETERNILLSGALKKNANISIALPNSNHLRSDMVNGVAQITATEVKSRVGNLKWTVLEGYLDEESNTITFTDCVAETTETFDLAYAKFFLTLSATDLGKTKADLVAVMNIPAQLKTTYDAQKGAMENLYTKQGTISMINDIDKVNGNMTVKGVLKSVADIGSLKDETKTAALELAESIPDGGSLPLVGTLADYKNGGMTYYYTTETKIIAQIDELYTALATMLSDDKFIEQVNNAKPEYVQKFIDARDLLKETLDELNSNPVNHNLVDVNSEALSGLLENLDKLSAKTYSESNVSDNMTWTEVVTTGAPGKSTITVSATYKGSQAITKSWPEMTGSTINVSEIEAAIAELATELDVEHAHYTEVCDTIPGTLTGNLTINVTWTAKQYKVMVDGIELGTVTIEGGTVKLPKHDKEYFTYNYDIDGTVVAEGTDYTFTRAAVEKLLDKDAKTVTITRTEVDHTPEYTIDIIVKAKVMSQTNAMVDAAPYSTYITLKLGESTDKVLAAAAQAVVEAKKQAGWEDVNDTYFDIVKTELSGDKVEESFTYTIEYTPKDVTFTVAGENVTVTYGSWYTLPSHADEAKEYIYTIGADTYDQGQKVKINGELNIERAEQDASAKEYLTSLLIKAGKITDETIINILNSAALNKGKSIRIELPTGEAISAVAAADGSVKITVVPVNSKIEGKQWIASKGYLDISPATKFDFVDGSYTVTGQDAEKFDKAFAIYELALTAEALNVESKDLLNALNLAYELKADYTAQKTILNNLGAKQATFAMMNDTTPLEGLPEGFEGKTFKGVLNMASVDVGVGPDAVQAAKALALLIPEDGVLPFATTLDTYNNSTDGMLHFYQNAQISYLPQITQLYNIIEVLANDDGLMGLMSSSQKQMFTDALNLLTEAKTLSSENSIDYDRIDVSSPALGSLLANIAKSEPTQATEAPTELVLTEEVDEDAPGKFTVTIKVNYGDGKEEKKTFMINSALTEDYVNEVINRLANELGVPVDYYIPSVDDYPDTVTESITINVNYTAKTYKVIVENEDGTMEELGTVDYINSSLNLPVNDRHVADLYPEGWYYTYIINGVKHEVRDAAVPYNFKDLLPITGDTINISREELDEREEYTINIIVNAQVMSQTNDLIDLAPYNFTPFKMKRGDATTKVLEFAKSAVELAKQETGWEDVNDTYFTITKSDLGAYVESDITYIISYTPNKVTFTVADEQITMTYGSWYTLPEHTNEAMEYIYTIGEETYDQGQKWKVNGAVEIMRTEQEASAKEYLTSLLIKTGKITDEALLKILNNDALNKGKSIRIQLPDGSAITAENQADGSVKITVVPVSSKVGDAKWTATTGYLDVATKDFSFDENGSYIVSGDDAKNFNKAYANFKLVLTPEALGITSADLLAALNLPYELKTDYTNQKNTLDALAKELDTFKMMNDDPNQTYELQEGMGAMTFKELLITASGEMGESLLAPTTLTAAKALADLIPENGVLPFVGTLETYNNSENGMLDFYKNAEKSYLPQITQLYNIIQVLAKDGDLMGLLSADQKKMFTDALDLLTEANKLNNEYAIDYERIDVTSQSLASLLANIATAEPEKADTAPTQLELTEVVSKDAPGKYTVTISVKFGEEKTYSWTAFENDPLDKNFINERIAELTTALNVPVAYYDTIVSNIPEKVTESITINVSFVAKDYKVVVENEDNTTVELGYVTIEEPWLNLPINKEHQGEQYADGWYYTYIIGTEEVAVREDEVSYDFTDMLPADGKVITISRVELDERPRYEVTIVVKGQVVNPATVDDKTLVDLTTYTHPTALEFVIGTEWDAIAQAIASSGAEAAALALVDWKGVTADYYNRTTAGDTTELTQNITYTISYSPKYMTVEFNGEKDLVPYGYRLSLPEHEAPAEGETEMEYVYTINGKDYDQGSIYKVVEDATITVREQVATAKQYLTTLLVNTNTVTDSILSNAALIKGQSITIALPESKHLVVVSDAEGQLITAELVNSRVGSLQWDADKGYLDVDNNGKYDEGVDVAFDFAEDNTYLAKEDYFKVFATYELPVTVDALGIAPEELLAVMNVPYELKKDYDNQKRVLDAILEQKPIFDMMNDASTIEGLPEQFAGMTFKGVLNLASGSTGAQMGLNDATRTKAAELASKIPVGGELPFVATLRNYESSGMIDFYQNEMTYRTQINELNDIMTILTADSALMALIDQAGMKTAFNDAQKLLAEAYKLNDEYAINHDRINVSNANALKTLLADLDSDTVRKQYELSDIPAEMVWTQEVSAAAMGKVTVTVEGSIDGFYANPTQIILNSGDAIDLDELNAIIAKMEAELGITENAKHYACEISTYPDVITEDITITAKWAAKEYGVFVGGVENALGTVTIDGGTVTLPAHANANFTYIYTIGTEKPGPSDFQFTPAMVDALVNEEGKIVITRLEVNAAENELTNKVNAMGATLLKDENGEYTMVLELDTAGLQDSLIQFIFGLILGSFDSVDMGGQPFYADGQYRLQTMIDLIMNSGLDSESLLKMIGEDGMIISDLFLPAANVLPATGEAVTGNVDLGAKVVTSTITLAYKAFNGENTSKTMKFYITLAGGGNDMASVRSAIIAAKEKGITFVLDEGFNANIDLNDEIYAAYVAALSMVGQADVDNLDELNAEIAFGYLADQLEAILKDTSVTTIKNTVGVDIAEYEKYYNLFKDNYSADRITYGDNDSRATLALNNIPISGALDALQGTVDSMAASFGVSLELASMIYEYETGLNLAASVDLLNLDKHYVALAFNAQTKDLQSIACAMTAEDLKNIGNYNAVMLLADVNGDLNFASSAVLDLNGMTVNGNISANGKLIITDSNYVNAPGHVTGTVSGSDVTIVSGNFDTDVSEHLDGGYIQENGVVHNKFFTTTSDGENITVTLNTTPDDLAELANKQGLIDMAMEIAAGVLVNHYNMASLSFGNGEETYKIYDIQIKDVVGLYKSTNKVNALIDTVLGCVSAADLADLVDEIVAQLTDFAGLENKLLNTTEIMRFTTETAPWNLAFEHIAKGDYLTVNIGAAEQKKTGSLSIEVIGSQVDELANLAGALAESVTVIESDFNVKDIVRSGNNIVIEGTYNGGIEIDFRQHPEYVIMMAVVLANGNEDIRDEMVAGIKAYYETNKMSMSALEDAFDALTVDDITTALANTGRNDSFLAMIKALGLSDIANDSCFDDTALGYDLAIDLLGVLLRRYSPSIKGTLGGLKKTDADKHEYYGLQGSKMLHREGNPAAAGYVLDYDVTVTADYARLYLFPSDLRVEDYEFTDKYITDALKNAQFDTVEKIGAELRSVVTQKMGNHAQSVWYEVQLEYFDVTTGKWVAATKEHFPVDKDGEYCLYVEMDVPAGADITKDKFIVVHMFSENMKNEETGRETKAGEIEVFTMDHPDKAKRIEKHVDRNKISFFVTGLSPIMIGWTCDCANNGLVAYPANDATCVADGNTAYYYCPECDSYFSDAACMNKIDEGSWVIAKTNNHTLTKVNATDPTCTEDGNSEYYSCSVCGKYFSDAAGKNEIAKDSWVINKLGHKYGEPVWAWIGYSSATATFTCANCSGTEKITVQPTYVDAVQPDGSIVRTWTATVEFDGKIFADTKTETIPAPAPTDPTVGVPTVPKMPAEMLAFKVDATKGIIYVDLAADGITIEKMCAAVTAEVTNDADNKAEVTIKASKQTPNKLVTNGSVLTVTAENVSGKASGNYTIIVLGDTNSNGRTDSGDSFRVRMHYQDDLDLSKVWYELEAADINRNGRIESGDAVKNQVKYNDAENYKTHLK